MLKGKKGWMVVRDDLERMGTVFPTLEEAEQAAADLAESFTQRVFYVVEFINRVNSRREVFIQTLD